MKVSAPSEQSGRSAEPAGTVPVADAVALIAERARHAAPAWAATSLRDRLHILKAARGLLAEHADRLAAIAARIRRRPVSEAMVSEVIPLIESVRFLEREAERHLAPRKVGRRGRPVWLPGVDARVVREPWGVVLVIGPSNYPLFLPGTQALQALAAGNAVLVKPGAGCSEAIELLFDLLHHAGLDHRLAGVLPEAIESVRASVERCVDKVFFTGSAETGARVLADLAPHLTPATMELSGCDAVIVRRDADLDLAVRALLFGATLNAGATCIAPRRVFVHRSSATEFEGRVADRFAEATLPEVRLSPSTLKSVRAALDAGGHLVAGELGDDGLCTPPLVVACVPSSVEALHTNPFDPVISLVSVEDDHGAVRLANQSPYALGATIFSANLSGAHALARRLQAGIVVINDMIVPTADPRLPFGGFGRSGFGVTRGPEGLLEMTRPKVITLRKSRFLPHLQPASGVEETLFSNFIRMVHGSGIRSRVGAAANLLKIAMARKAPEEPETQDNKNR